MTDQKASALATTSPSTRSRAIDAPWLKCAPSFNYFLTRPVSRLSPPPTREAACGDAMLTTTKVAPLDNYLFWELLQREETEK